MPSNKELETQAKIPSKASKGYGKQGTIREKVPVKEGPQQGNLLEISGKNTLQNKTFEQNKQSVQTMEKAFAISKDESTLRRAKMQQNIEPVLAIDGAFDISKHEQSKKKTKLETKKKHSTISLNEDSASKLALKKRDSVGSIRKADLESSGTDSLYESDDESSFSESEGEFNENNPRSMTPVLVVKEQEEIHEIEPPRDRNEVYFTDDQHTAASLCFFTWL